MTIDRAPGMRADERTKVATSLVLREAQQHAIELLRLQRSDPARRGDSDLRTDVARRRLFEARRTGVGPEYWYG